MRTLANVGLVVTLAACASASSNAEIPTDPAVPTVVATPPPRSEPAAKPSAAQPAPAPVRARHTIEELALTFELPSSAWKRHQGLGEPKDGVTQIGFERDELRDAAGTAVRPFCGITSELVPPEARDIVKYSISPDGII